MVLAALGFALYQLRPEPPAPDRVDFTPAWTGARLEERDGFSVLRLAGTPRERGRAHGEQLRGRIEAWYERVRPRAGDTEALYVQSLGPRAAASLTPDLRAEIEGIAEGCGLSFEQIWYLNLRFELRGFHGGGVGFAGPAAVGSFHEVVRRFEPGDLGGPARELVVFVRLDPQPLVMVGLPGMAGGFIGVRGRRGATLRPVQEAPTPVLTGLPWTLLLRRLLEADAVDTLPAAATLDASAPVVRADGTVGTLDLSPRAAIWHETAGDFAMAHPEPLSERPDIDVARLRQRVERARRILTETPPARQVSVRLKAGDAGVRITVEDRGVPVSQSIRYAD